MINELKHPIQTFTRDRVGVYNGVAVRDVPWYSWNDYRPVHKQRLWEATRRHVSTDDRVVFVGGGKGVVPIKTAQFGADVLVIEAAAEMVAHLRETATLNQQEIGLIHGLVEAGHDVYGDASQARQMSTADLSGDMLVLDCEGAERDILPAPQFETVVVETHPQHGADTLEVAGQMTGEVEQHATARHPGDFLIRT